MSFPAHAANPLSRLVWRKHFQAYALHTYENTLRKLKHAKQTKDQNRIDRINRSITGHFEQFIEKTRALSNSDKKALRLAFDSIRYHQALKYDVAYHLTQFFLIYFGRSSDQIQQRKLKKLSQDMKETLRYSSTFTNKPGATRKAVLHFVTLFQGLTKKLSLSQLQRLYASIGHKKVIIGASLAVSAALAGIYGRDIYQATSKRVSELLGERQQRPVEIVSEIVSSDIAPVAALQIGMAQVEVTKQQIEETKKELKKITERLRTETNPVIQQDLETEKKILDEQLFSLEDPKNYALEVLIDEIIEKEAIIKQIIEDNREYFDRTIQNNATEIRALINSIPKIGQAIEEMAPRFFKRVAKQVVMGKTVEWAIKNIKQVRTKIIDNIIEMDFQEKLRPQQKKLSVPEKKRVANFFSRILHRKKQPETATSDGS